MCGCRLQVIIIYCNINSTCFILALFILFLPYVRGDNKGYPRQKAFIIIYYIIVFCLPFSYLEQRHSSVTLYMFIEQFQSLFQLVVISFQSSFVVLKLYNSHVFIRGHLKMSRNAYHQRRNRCFTVRNNSNSNTRKTTFQTVYVAVNELYKWG